MTRLMFDPLQLLDIVEGLRNNPEHMTVALSEPGVTGGEHIDATIAQLKTVGLDVLDGGATCYLIQPVEHTEGSCLELRQGDGFAVVNEGGGIVEVGG